MDGVSWEALVAALVIVALAALVQGIVGFGANMVSAPLLVQLDPDLVPGPLLLVALAMTVSAWRREHDDVHWPTVRLALAGRLPGIALGALVLARTDTDTSRLVVGLVLLAAVAASASGWHLQPSRVNLTVAGCVSGFSGTTTAVGGPPLALVLQSEAGPRIRASLAAYFTLGLLVTLPATAAAGRLGGSELVAGLVLVPPALAGFAASGPLRHHADRGRLRPAVLAVSALGSFSVVVRVLLAA